MTIPTPNPRRASPMTPIIGYEPQLHQVLARTWRPVADMPLPTAGAPWRWHLAPSEQRALTRACLKGRAQTATTRRNGRLVLLARIVRSQ